MAQTGTEMTGETLANQGISLSDDAAHLLIVDDDARIRSLLSRFLQEQGFRVTLAEDAAAARRHLANLDFDLMVLDLMMPGESGLELSQTLQNQIDMPILMLTAKAEIDDRIAGLSGGADDYLVKPFDPRELLLRINNILRRSREPDLPLREFVCFGPYRFHLERGELKRGEALIHLTDREKDILKIFALRAGEVVPRQDLLNEGEETSERTVDVQINRLRRKIEVEAGNPLYLQTVRGIGYRLMSD